MVRSKFFLNLFLFAVIIFASLLSCDDGSERILPDAHGRVGDIFVVVDSSMLYSHVHDSVFIKREGIREFQGLEKKKIITPLGKAIFNCFEEIQPGLPQPTPIFTVTYIEAEYFDGGYSKQRSIVRVGQPVAGAEAKLTVNKDLWAEGQTIVDLNAGSLEGLEKLILDETTTLQHIFKEKDREHLMENHRQRPEPYIWNTLAKNHNVSVLAPKGYIVAVDTPGFVWLRKETTRSDRGILIYYYDYSSDSVFTTEEIIKTRDAVTMKYIPDEREGAYMITDTIRVKYENEVNIKGNYAKEIRGLWKMKGRFYGGPYITYSVIDTVRNRVLCLDGFVYYARTKHNNEINDNRNKREYLRETEAIIHSFEFQ